MKINKTLALTLAVALSTPLVGCDLEVGDLNNPGIANLEDNPTESVVIAATTGLLIGGRRNHAAANGYVAQLGILGRDAYNFDQADPRFIEELLSGVLAPGSPFGGAFWTGPYANIRLANLVIAAVPQVPSFNGDFAARGAGITGFAKTSIALDLLEVVNTRDDIGAVIDTDRPLDAELAPLEDKPVVLAFIAAKLDEGAADLALAGEEFAFPLSSGYEGFDTPATYLTFNRALRARVAVYQGDYATALTALAESFIDDVPAMGAVDFDAGVYYVYSTGPGDTTNGLINPNIFAHPSVQTDAEPGDQRFANKVEVLDPDDAGGEAGLSSNLKFTLYTSPDSPVPLIRNEELILLKAEAQYFTGLTTEAVDTLNIVRELSGELDPLVGPLDEEAFIDALLYERRYSLLFEGGHRWIDLRRFGRALPLDMPGYFQNLRYPLPSSECNARGGAEAEPRCALGSVEE